MATSMNTLQGGSSEMLSCMKLEQARVKSGGLFWEELLIKCFDI